MHGSVLKKYLENILGSAVTYLDERGACLLMTWTRLNSEKKKKKKDQSREFGSIRAVKISLDMMTEKEPGKRVRNDTMS